MNEGEIKQELKGLIDQQTDLRILEAAKALFTEEVFDYSIEKQMISRALKSEQDIKEGKLYKIEEAEQRLNKHLGL